MIFLSARVLHHEGVGIKPGHLLEMMIHVAPTHASQVSLASVWMLARLNPIMAATATNTAVHVAWLDTALRPMEIPSMPEPATKIQSARCHTCISVLLPPR